MSMNVGELSADLGLDDKQFERALQAAHRSFLQAAKKMDGAAPPKLDVDTKPMEKGLKDADSKFRAGLDKMRGAAVGGAAIVGGLIGAGIAKGIAESLDRGAVTSKLGAKLWLNTEEAKATADIAAKIYGEAYGDSFADVNKTIAEVIQSIDFGGAEDGLEGITKKALDLKAAFDAETGGLAGSVTVAGVLLKNGLVKSADEAFDIITVGFMALGPKADELLETFNEYAEPIASLGLSAADFTAQMIQGAEKGVWSIDKIGDAIKEFALRAVDGSESTNNAFENIGLSAWDMSHAIAAGGPRARDAMSLILKKLGQVGDKVDQDAAGVALFGSMWEDIGPKVILGLNPATLAVSNFAGAADNLGKTLADNNATKIEVWKRAIENGLVATIDRFVIPALGRLEGWWQEKGPGLQKWFTDTFGEEPLINFGRGMDIVNAKLDEVFGPNKLENFKNGIREIFAIPAEADITDTLRQRWADVIRELELGAVIVYQTIGPAWEGLGKILMWLKDEALDPLIGALQKGVPYILESIGMLFSGIKEKLLDPIIGMIQTILEKLKDLAFLGGILPQVAVILGEMGVPGFDAGGTVPGPRGAPKLILAHGGETVLPTHKMSAPSALGLMPRFTAGDGAAAAAAGGSSQPIIQTGPVTIHEARDPEASMAQFTQKLRGLAFKATGI